MKLENPSVTGLEAGEAPAVIRTKPSNATLVEVPSHVSRFGYDRGRLRSGIVHIGVGNFSAPMRPSMSTAACTFRDKKPGLSSGLVWETVQGKRKKPRQFGRRTVCTR
jgi:hypothetical protein